MPTVVRRPWCGAGGTGAGDAGGARYTGGGDTEEGAEGVGLVSVLFLRVRRLFLRLRLPCVYQIRMVAGGVSKNAW
jgi:hypothetical protein